MTGQRYATGISGRELRHESDHSRQAVGITDQRNVNWGKGGYGGNGKVSFVREHRARAEGERCDPGERRLRRETVEGFPLFVSTEARAEGERCDSGGKEVTEGNRGRFLSVREHRAPS